jgi:hypothetical protein
MGERRKVHHPRRSRKSGPSWPVVPASASTIAHVARLTRTHPASARAAATCGTSRPRSLASALGLGRHCSSMVAVSRRRERSRAEAWASSRGWFFAFAEPHVPRARGPRRTPAFHPSACHGASDSGCETSRGGRRRPGRSYARRTSWRLRTPSADRRLPIAARRSPHADRRMPIAACPSRRRRPIAACRSPPADANADRRSPPADANADHRLPMPMPIAACPSRSRPTDRRPPIAACRSRPADRGLPIAACPSRYPCRNRAVSDARAALAAEGIVRPDRVVAMFVTVFADARLARSRVRRVFSPVASPP